MEIFDFNTNEIKLREEFESKFNCHSSNWDEKFKDMPISELVELGHKVLKSDSFLNVYKDLVLLMQDHIGEELCCQKRPTFRIQRKAKKSVDFHTDEILSGHPQNMINVWIPLCKTFNSNGMWIVNEENTKSLLKKFKLHNWSIDKLNKCSLEVANPHPIVMQIDLTRDLKGTFFVIDDMVDK